MIKTDVGDRWNPFSWRSAELATLGMSPADQARRAELEQELLLAEAEAAARGGVYLSIVHGDPSEMDAGRHLGDLYDIVGKLVAEADWHRLLIEPDHIIIEVAGVGAEERVYELAGAAERLNPGHWRITRRACPDLSPGHGEPAQGGASS